MRVDEVTLPGARGVPLVGWIWRPDATARVLVWLSHGYAEHLGRYVHEIFNEPEKKDVLDLTRAWLASHAPP